MILSVNLVLITPHYFRSNLESVNGDNSKWDMICVCQNNVFSVTKFVKVSADTGNTPCLIVIRTPAWSWKSVDTSSVVSIYWLWYIGQVSYDLCVYMLYVWNMTYSKCGYFASTGSRLLDPLAVKCLVDSQAWLPSCCKQSTKTSSSIVLGTMCLATTLPDD